MTDDIKGKMIEAIPYVAVLGIAALAAYGVSRLVRASREIDVLPLDFYGYDINLSRDMRYYED